MRVRNWNTLDRLNKALDESRVLKITYKRLDGVVTTREVEPLMVYICDYGHVTLLAYCRLRGGYRTFLLKGITSSTLMYEKFDYKPHTKTLLNKLVSIIGISDITNLKEAASKLLSHNVKLIKV